MKYSGIIFDCDGTLADTLDDIAGCANECAESLGFQPVERKKYHYLVGNGIKYLAEKLLKTSDEKLISRFAGEFSLKLPSWQLRHTHLYQGIPRLLDQLKSKGIKTAVLSNKPQPLLKLLVEKLLPDYPFSAVLGETKERKRKPDPAGAHEACRLLTTPSTKVLYIGDTSTDMETGRAAGLKTIGVLWGYRRAKELVESGAEALVSKPEELLPLLKTTPNLDLLATERLVIRKTVLQDFHPIEGFLFEKEANLLDHGNTNPGTWKPDKLLKLQKDLKQRPSNSMWSLLLPHNLEVIGYVRLRNTNIFSMHGMIAVRLGRNWWGKGYAAEALKILCPHIIETKRLKIIELEVLADNTRGLRAYEKAGFILKSKFDRDNLTWCSMNWHL